MEPLDQLLMFHSII